MGLRNRRPVGHRQRLAWRGEVSWPVGGERPEPRVGEKPSRVAVKGFAETRRSSDRPGDAGEASTSKVIWSCRWRHLRRRALRAIIEL